MQCPVCQKNCESSATFCPRCAWAFRMYVGEAPPEENQRLKIARRNWRISISQAKTSAQNPKTEVSNRSKTETSDLKATSEVESLYSPDTPVTDLRRDAFETVEEFHARIKKAHKPVLVGTANLIKDRYDIHTGHFPLKIDWMEWAKPIKTESYGYINAERGLARSIFKSGPEHPVYASLNVNGEKTVIKNIELYVDNRPIKVKLSLFYIRPKYSLRFEPFRDVSDEEEAELRFNLDDHRHPKKYVQNEFKLIHNGNLVADLSTGLMWQQSGSKKEMTYEETVEYIESINDEKLAGFNDWRLPTIDELVSLLTEKVNKPSMLHIDPIFEGDQYWCWTADESAHEGAWSVWFELGEVELLSLDDEVHVRAVRCGL